MTVNNTAPALWRTLWHHRELIQQLTRRRLQQRYKHSLLGFVWQVVEPLLRLALYYMVFGLIFDGSFGVAENETGVTYALGIFLGLALYTHLADNLGSAVDSIVHAPDLVKKVVFPHEILPVCAVLASLQHLLISLALVLTGVMMWGHGLSPGAAQLLFILPPLVAFALGLGWGLSALGVYIRDLRYICDLLSMLLFWSSGIFYAAASVREEAPGLWQILRYNPLLHLVEEARAVVLWGRPLQWDVLLLIYLISGLTAYLGYRVFKRLQPGFADVL